MNPRPCQGLRHAGDEAGLAGPAIVEVIGEGRALALKPPEAEWTSGSRCPWIGKNRRKCLKFK
jgi:hypothetical protein